MCSAGVVWSVMMMKRVCVYKCWCGRLEQQTNKLPPHVARPETPLLPPILLDVWCVIKACMHVCVCVPFPSPPVCVCVKKARAQNKQGK